MKQETKELDVLAEYYRSGYLIMRDAYFGTINKVGGTSAAKQAARQAWHDYQRNQSWPTTWQPMIPL